MSSMLLKMPTTGLMSKARQVIKTDIDIERCPGVLTLTSLGYLYDEVSVVKVPETVTDDSC